ncbi:MAG TPA: LysE family translocator [Solimonas sp.]|nr:LysE family translocator [Solimonas sp.]
MSSLAIFGTVALAHLLAVISPGPDFVVVSRQTLQHGRAAGLWTAWGIASGIVFHVCWGLLGLAWLLEQAPAILEWMRYGGAAFLLAMGVSALRSKPAAAVTDAPLTAPAAPRSYWIGVMTNLLNPKAALFFIALFSAVITSSTPMGLRLLLGSWIVLSTGAWFSLVAVSVGHPRVRGRLVMHAWLIDRTMGALLIALALLLLLG